ncbi:MAG: trypsin-like peptidase domain-containing protein [Clostridia bacterium]|nr:trypsin-like peptidase domain-containing protein [Clostridia bacterium]
MSELPQQNQNQQQDPVQSGEQYSFYWNYNTQLAHDRAQKEKGSKRGVVIYASVMTAVFAVCFIMLACVILWHQSGGVVSAGSAPAVYVSEAVSPSTVLISASTGLEGSYGTGFFFQTNGYIATNYHVVKNATNISVHLYDGTVKDAELVGYVEIDDIAVLKIEGRNYPAVAFGDSDALTEGEVAIAIGNPGGDDGEWSTTQGIISKCHRVVTVEESKYVADLNMIQMDTPVNPGNSGGPLCNANGEVIGIITRKMTDFEGIGYAIPINKARNTIDAIMEGREDSFTSTVSKVRPKLGILVTDVRKGTQFQVGGRYYTAMQDGVAVSEVYVDSYAHNVILPGDVICGFNGKTVTDKKMLQEYLHDVRLGDTISLKVYRDAELLELKLYLGN